MPWYIPHVPEGIKKRVCIYLLQRYLGQFFEEKLTLDQLSVDLYNGTGTVEDVSLDVQALNELGEKQNWPMEFVDGYLEKLSINVPWTSLLKESSFVEVKGLKLTVQPKQRTENGIMEYFDEAGHDPPADESADNVQDDKAYVVSSFTCKDLYLEGVTLSTVEFPSSARTFSRSVINQSQVFSRNDERQDSLVSMVQNTDNDNNKVGSGAEQNLYDIKDSADDQRHVIIFGKITGRQEIRIRLKQSENINGPKVSIETNFGSFSVFLSPRQVHILLELIDGLASPDTEDTSNVPPRQKCTEKPMTGLDYQRIEQELQHQIQPLSGFQASALSEGWSKAPLEENDDHFLPMRNTSNTMCDSTMSVVSSSMESSLSSSMGSSLGDASSRTRRKMSTIESDPTAEISHFQVRIASLALILLHEDLLTYSTDNMQSVVPASVQQMQNTAKFFFDNLPFVTGYGNKDFESVRPLFDKACRLSHLRLLATPIQAEAKETTAQTAFSVSGKLTASQLELLECLSNSKDEPVDHVKLLVFTKPPNTSSPHATKPCLTLNFKHTERTAQSGFSRHSSTPKTDLGFVFNNCTVELDITIIDRISALLNPLPVCVIHKPSQNVWNVQHAASVTSSQSEYKMDIKITSPSATLKLRYALKSYTNIILHTLRFPMPDFRPQHDMQRTPWWKRNVRHDFLSLQLSDMDMQTTLQSGQTSQKYVLECRSIEVFYYENENELCTLLGRAGVEEKYTSLLNDAFNWPRLVLQIFPEEKVDVVLEQNTSAESDIMNQSMYGTLIGQNPKHPGPFSAKRVIHQSDTPHVKSHHDDTEELIIPGDKQEIDEFIEVTSQNCRYQLQVTLPIVSMQLANKHVYEVLYNRINSDLLLWEPSAPKPKSPNFGKVTGGFPTLSAEHEIFAMCKSGIQYDSDSESEDDPEQYYSVYDTKMKRSLKQRPQISTETKSQSEFVLNLHISLGIITMNTPVRDVATNVIPCQQGEFVFSVEDATVFSVSGYNGDTNLGYVCVQVKSAQLHHCDMLSTPSQSPPLLEVGTAIPKYLHPTILKSEPGVLQTCSDRGGNRDMVSVAIKIQASHETHHVKTVRVAVGLNKATLKHRMCLGPNSWITQLIDFFNVVDYAIPGYNAKDVLTELHVHLWDCAIDYRPLYLPLRAIVTLGNFSMSSHLSAQANTSTLRFIAEECDLFLSEKAPSRNGIPSSAPVDLKRDYVNVIELGLFELSLRTNDKKTGINPHIDLRASNNILHIRTCADSGRALMQLITYFASDGDLQQNSASSTPSSTYSSPRHNIEQELVAVEPQNISKLSKSQHQQVNELLGEAMQESILVNDNSGDPLNSGAELFFFPGESNLSADNGKPLPQVTTELGDVVYRSNKSSDTDDEFCFVDRETGLGILPKNGLPEIKWLTDMPLHITDNHFSLPIGKTDMLKPPAHFPIPVYRYTLREMTIVWHMYGGNDFKKHEPDANKKVVHFSDTAMSTNVGFINSKAGEVIISNVQKKKQNFSWQVKGGVNRNHSVLMQLQLNKVRFQHEVYPENTSQASRQVLLVSELEIRDRLESSQMNKFLYQYVSESRPKQSHAHMIVIKAVHVRPDPKLRAQECHLRVSMLPLRLNIDQDSLLFLIDFFTELSDTSSTEETVLSSKHNTPTHQPPVMTVSDSSYEQQNETSSVQSFSDNLLQLTEEDELAMKQIEAVNVNNTVNEDCSPIYFRIVRFVPDVPIRLDYHGKRLDMTHGPLAGLLMGLAHLNCSELRLKSLHNRNGLLGAEKLISYCLQEWLEDIKSNQLPSLLGGVGPMHSLVQLFQGIKDLFWLPIEQYQKDGRIVRGLQRGANSFTKSTLMAALELTSRIIHLVLITAETAYDMMSPGPSVKRIRHTQPQDFREGVAKAYMLVKEGLGETADNLVRVASHEREQKGYSGAVGGVLRQIPPTIVKPIIIASEATNKVLGGVRSQLVPDIKREAIEKWKTDEG
ncbi:autophagy-related 2 isoform a [Holotrichia oblita]|uniref:Autophagy-related 2 isoform a n=1 Tax=Holotrichia oblita TaxID=644536 RepID=A0ACB9TPE2_HOLOL|nr:autophagy-related 2 isoform a [Holotrichia oblita]